MKRKWWFIGVAFVIVLYLSQKIQIGIRYPELIPTGYLVQSTKLGNSVRVYRSYPDGSLAPLYDPVSADSSKNWTTIGLILNRTTQHKPVRSLHVVSRSFRLKDGTWVGSRDDTGVTLPVEVHATFDP